MENKSSKEYIAELLQQLEELKRKKALKERKLQKLKISAQVDHQKVQVPLNKTSDPFSSVRNCLADCVIRGHSNEEICPSSTTPESTKTVCYEREKNKEIYSYNNIDSSHTKLRKTSELQSLKCAEHSVETGNENVPYLEKYESKHVPESENCREFRIPTCGRPIISHLNRNEQKFFCAKNDSSFPDDGCNNEKSFQLICNESGVHEQINSNREANRRELCTNSDIVSSPTNSDRKDDISAYDDSKKLCNAKEKGSEILDDSLSSNMSCFLVSELFPASDDKPEITPEIRSPLENTKGIETLELITMEPNTLLSTVPETLEITTTESKTSLSTVPNNVTLKTQSNMDYFNFPKFSTPTDGINFLSSSDENVLNQSVVSNACSVSAFKAIPSVTDYVCPIIKADKDDFPPENKFDPVFIIGKGVTSVLDAHYQSPKKSVTTHSSHDKTHSLEIYGATSCKKIKLFSDETSIGCLEHRPKLDTKIQSSESDKENVIDDMDFNYTHAFSSQSGSFGSSANYLSDNIPSLVTEITNGLINKVCEDSKSAKCLENDTSPYNKNRMVDSEILIIPETEGLEINFIKNTEEFLETSTLSESLEEFHVKDNQSNVSSQSKLESPVVNQIVAAVKTVSANVKKRDVTRYTFDKGDKNIPSSTFDNSLSINTSFLEDDTQELGNYMQVPYMNEKNVPDIHNSYGCETKSNLNFICSLYGASNEAVVDVEIVVFGNVKYVFIQHKTQIHVWRQEKEKEWIKIFSHQIEDALSLQKICLTKDDHSLVVVMLLSNDEQYCLQFLLFEKDARVIKLMENTHWLEERHSEDSVLLCGLDGLMFSTTQASSGVCEVSLHAFLSLRDSPRLISTVLGSTEGRLHSLCKINSLPNALIGVDDTMLYVWHVHEARLVTAVLLHPSDHLPIGECFWATVENGLIFLLTTCVGGPENHRPCQLLAVNLATGFCQAAMAYSPRPSRVEAQRITKAAYEEPFLVVSDAEGGAFLWSVGEEHCCAALPFGVTSVSIARDCGRWGIVAVGNGKGHVECYALD